ncbi:MAG: glycosyltransferase family 39 protein [Candidatus Hydrogenedens sp.]|nr:glycosyltransferase family 39 protein [Candidatus Hydrogenedens sp.]
MERNKENNYVRDIILIGLWALVLFGANIWGYDLWSPDEPRYAEVAREMQVMNNYLVPHVNGRPYLEKPPLLMWLMIVCSYPFGGEVSEIPARLPSVLSGVVATILTYLLARRLAHRKIAMLSALIFMTMQRVWWQARFGQIDMLLTALLLFALYAFHSWYYSERRDWKWLIIMYLCLGGALFAKGPGTLVFPVLFFLVFYWREKREVIKIHPIGGFGAIIVLYGLWYVYARWVGAEQMQEGSVHVMGSDLFKQTLGRFIYGVSHPQPPWYYFISVPIDMFPWSIFLLWVIPWVWKNRNEHEYEGLRFLLLWVVPTFIFFSIAVGKRAIYLLPIFPMLAIITALSLMSFESTSTKRWKKGIRILWMVLLLILAVVPYTVFWTEIKHIWNSYWILLSAVALIAIIDTFIDFVKQSEKRSLLRQIPQHVSLYLILTAFVLFPSVNQIKSVRYFCEPLRQWSEENKLYEAYSFGFEEEEYTYYAKHFIIPFFSEKELDAFLTEQSEPYEFMKQISEVHKQFAKTARKINFNDILLPTSEEITQIKSVLEEVKIEADKKGKINIFNQIELMLNKKIEELHTILKKETPVFMLIRDEDWKWVVALKPELGSEVKIINKRDELDRSMLLLANKPASITINKK